VCFALERNCADGTEKEENRLPLYFALADLLSSVTAVQVQAELDQPTALERERNGEGGSGEGNARLSNNASESSMSLLFEFATKPAISRAASILRRSRKLREGKKERQCRTMGE
jgi:hypothetical protein